MVTKATLSFLVIHLLALGSAMGVTPGCGGSSSVSCENPTTSLKKGQDCVNASCSSEISSLGSSCPGLLSCWAGCSCASASGGCLGACITQHVGIGASSGPACMTAYMAYGKCSESMCGGVIVW
jgi:hypothetical protein